MSVKTRVIAAAIAISVAFGGMLTGTAYAHPTTGKKTPITCGKDRLVVVTRDGHFTRLNIHHRSSGLLTRYTVKIYNGKGRGKRGKEVFNTLFYMKHRQSTYATPWFRPVRVYRGATVRFAIQRKGARDCNGTIRLRV